MYGFHGVSGSAEQGDAEIALEIQPLTNPETVAESQAEALRFGSRQAATNQHPTVSHPCKWETLG